MLNRKWLWCALACALMTAFVSAQTILPPVVTLRDIADMPRQAKGKTIQLHDNTTLFIPDGFQVPKSKEITLTIHFHGADWFVIEEHARRGAKNPLLVFSGFEGSSKYKAPFEDGTLFAKLIKMAEDYFDAHVNEIEISSFSAGYGAVREIIKSPAYVRLIKTVVLADSCYASFAVKGGGADRKPLPEHMEPFIDFANLALKGDKKMVMTFSHVPTQDYASTSDTARALVEGVSGNLLPVRKNTILASHFSLRFPLLLRYDNGGLHVWGYGGRDAKAHMAQARSIADFFAALDKPVPNEAVPPLFTSDIEEPTTGPQPLNILPKRVVPGKRFALTSKQQLFIPDFFKPEVTTQTHVVVFFHGAAWCSEQNFYEAHKNAVLVSISEDRMVDYAKWGEHFIPMLQHVQETLAENGITTKPISVCVASFSGGYRAVLEILKQPEHVSLISDVVLADSLYPPRLDEGKGGLDPEPLGFFLQYAQRAADGKIKFLFSHLYPPEPEYRDNKTNLAAEFLMEKLGLAKISAAGYTSRGSQIMYRASRGGLLILGYAGMTSQDHFEHFYALSDLLSLTSLPSAL